MRPLLFTKKHFKSSCSHMVFLGFILAFIGTAVSSLYASETTSKEPKSTLKNGLPAFAYGTYKVAQDSNLKEENRVVVENFIESLPFYVKPIAGPRLRKQAAPFQTIEFKQKGHLLGIKTDNYTQFAWTTVDGQFQEFKNTPKGDFKLRRWVEGGALYSEGKKPDALKRSQYLFFADGTLKVQVTVRSPYLPKPLSLCYSYKKTNY